MNRKHFVSQVQTDASHLRNATSLQNQALSRRFRSAYEEMLRETRQNLTSPTER